MSVQAAPPTGWSGDSNLSFLLEVNGVNAKTSNSANPIPVNLSSDISLSIQIHTGVNLTILSYTFTMSYLYIPIINQGQDLSSHGEIPANVTASFLNASIPLNSLLSYGGLGLISGTITGVFAFVYSNSTNPTLNSTVSENFVLRIGETGASAVMSVTGLVTVGFTVMSVFTLILSLDEFQRGIMAARKMRGASRGSDIGIFPRAVVLRRRPKKGEKIDRDELVRRVTQAAQNSWDHKRCPKCGKKWLKDATNCSKCGIDSQSAIAYFSDDIAEYAPKALTLIKPKSKVTVGALVDMGALQTKSVKVPLKKVAFSGMSLAGAYWSLMQMFYGATPAWVIILLSTTAGLVVSVLIGYFMNFLARVPKLGYD